MGLETGVGVIVSYRRPILIRQQPRNRREPKQTEDGERPEPCYFEVALVVEQGAAVVLLEDSEGVDEADGDEVGERCTSSS